MLSAVLDDSGGVDQFGVFYGGIVAYQEDWQALEERWNRILKRYELPEYHGSKMTQLTKGWRTKWRNNLNRDLIKTLAQLRGQIVGTTTFHSHFNNARERFGIVGDPSIICLEGAVQSSRKAAKAISGSEVFSVLLDTPRKGSEGKVARLMNDYMKCEAYRMASWSHGKRSESPALQAADFIANEMFRWMKMIDENPRAMPQSKLQELFSRSYREGLLFQSNVEAFEKMANEIRAGEAKFFSIELI